MSTIEIETALPASLTTGLARGVSRLIIDDGDAPMPATASRLARQC